MPTLYETLQSLYEVQQLDTQIARLGRAHAHLDTGAEAAQLAAAARDAANSQLTALHHVQAELKDSELKLKSVEDKRKTYNDRLYQGSITNPKELGNIEKEIAALGRQRGDLDERILDLMDKTETAQTASASAEATAQEAERRHKDIVASYQAKNQEIKLEVDQISRHRGELAALVEDKTLLQRYEAIRMKCSGLGIAKITEGSCGACHTTLPSTLIADVKDYASLQRCENCGRLLVA
jgi:predicted  nucleic acid-binding Zn-ribbon protein